ncbi:cupin domain-containing protein [candidate division WOR-3 bacterium]|nr:cupin domain-containing protein [candidate division WOR-3 bacterium]
MVRGHFQDVAQEKPHLPGADATIRWLISKKTGAPNFAMRVVELAKTGDRIPLHGHPYEHEILAIEGTGRVIRDDSEEAVVVGEFIYMPAGERHGFVNDGEGPFRFVCVIPNSGDARP